MGFFIRKAFKAGPLRFNLSKSGVGVSGGVTGARLGINKDGTYLYGGRHGLYYRDQLSRRRKKSKATSPADDAAQRVEQTAPGHADIFVDTETTYPQVYDLIEPHPFPDLKEKRKWVLKTLIWMIALALGAAAFLTDMEALWAASGLGVLIAIILSARESLWKRRGKTMVEKAAKTFEKTPKALSAKEILDFTDRAPDAVNERFLPDLYLLLLQITVEKQDNDHVFAFNKLEKQIPVSEEFQLETKKAMLSQMMDLMLQDHVLTEDQEEEIRELIKKLYLPEDFIFEELQYLDLAASLRDEAEQPTEPMAASIPLVQGETCYAEFEPVRLLEERVLDRFQKNRIKYRKVGYQIQLEGKMTLTDRRLVITGEGSREYRMNQILDVVTDLEANTIELVISGRKNPVILTCPKPVVVSARLENILSQMMSEQEVHS